VVEEEALEGVVPPEAVLVAEAAAAGSRVSMIE
jgi:hypothetical protein